MQKLLLCVKRASMRACAQEGEGAGGEKDGHFSDPVTGSSAVPTIHAESVHKGTLETAVHNRPVVYKKQWASRDRLF